MNNLFTLFFCSFRIKDKKRAFEAIMESDIAEQTKSDLSNAKVYAEGRGIRIPVEDSSNLPDVFTLIDTKLAF